jgi:hypothetical protein
MSYILDSKISNQSPSIKLDFTVRCERCSSIFTPPKKGMLKYGEKSYLIFHYLNEPYFIHETKSGFAVVYCSVECRNGHNHRYRRGAS